MTDFKIAKNFKNLNMNQEIMYKIWPETDFYPENL